MEKLIHGSTVPNRGRRRLSRTARLLTMLIGVLALTGPVAPATASAGRHTDTECGYAERLTGLALEQRRVMRFLADFRVLRDETDLARLAEPREGTHYYIYSHLYASIEGMGFTVVNAGESAPGKPTLLLYRPSPDAADTTDAFGPDFPYELVGWGYAGPYTPGQEPAYPDDPGLRCLVFDDWFVHERSVHPFDTWHNIPVPPVEEYHGQVAGSDPPQPEECDPPCVGAAHPRLWDIHLWTGRYGIPHVSMLYPWEPPLPGFDPEVPKGFFYPESGN